MSDEGLDGGDFAPWLADVRAAIAGERPADVPCGSCTACCTSSQFVHIAPEEVDTLAHVPAELLFPAPRMPRGHVLLGYDEHGRCPMLVDGGCSIYEHRPRTCRTYDCRVFPATGVAVDDDKPAVGRQAARWRFRTGTPADRAAADAVRAAGAFLDAHPDLVEGTAASVSGTQRAVLAIELHGSFVGEPPSPAEVRVAIGRRTRPPSATS